MSSSNSTSSPSSSSSSDTDTSSSSSASSVPGTSSSSSSTSSSTSSSISSSSSSSTTSSTPVSTSPSSTSTSTTTTSSPTSTTTSVSTAPPTTKVTTRTVISTPTTGTSPRTHTTVETSIAPGSTHTTTITNGGNPTSTNQTPSQLANGSGNSGSSSSGLSTGGTTAIAVVIPVVVVALLVGFGIWFWRRRKQKNLAAEERRKEVEDYGFNPNQDPSLPVVAADGPQMAEDQSSGYRGWGTMSASNRKASTTMSGGHGQQLSDAGNSYGGPNSPGQQHSDGHSSDAMMGQRDTFGSDDLGALGAAPISHSQNNAPIKRGVSNASSAYSAGGRSDHSDDAPPVPSGIGQAYDYTPTQGYGYSQHGPYGDGTYGGAQAPGMPVVQDVSARRNTRIQPGGSYQQGNSGISQNF